MPHLHFAQANQQKAFDIIEQCQIKQAWQSFAAMAQIAKNPKIVHIEYRNLLDEEDSYYVEYFEKQAKRILAVMSEQQRETILKLKFEMPDEIKIAGIEIYQAVLESGITTFDSCSNGEPIALKMESLNG